VHQATPAVIWPAPGVIRPGLAVIPPAPGHRGLDLPGLGDSSPGCPSAGHRGRVGLSHGRFGRAQQV
jgi:hypothetical protein